jgi:uncharacterized protein YndB with AHSA1/START domain
MPRVERETTVNVPAEKAFPYLADVSRHVEWAGHQLEVQKTSDGPIAVGSTFSSVGHQMGTHKGQVTITELVPNQKIVYESQDDVGHFRHYFVLAQKDGGTQITKGFEPLKLSLMFRVLSPFILRVAAPKGLAGDLQRIKEKLEAA